MGQEALTTSSVSDRGTGGYPKQQVLLGGFMALVVPVICASHKGHGCPGCTTDQDTRSHLSPERLAAGRGQAGPWEGAFPGEEQPCQAFPLLPIILSLCLRR